MIFHHYFNEELRLGLLEPDATERDWLLDRLDIPVRLREYNRFNELIGSCDEEELDVLIVSYAAVAENPPGQLLEIRTRFPTTALILLDDFDDGKLSKLATEVEFQDVMVRNDISVGNLARTIVLSVQRFRNQLLAESLREKAEKLAQAKADFASMVSHEILNPMTGILGYIKFLQRTELDAQQRSYLSTIGSSCLALSHLVKDILTLTKLEQGGMELTVSAFSPFELLSEVERQLRALEHEKDVRLITFCDPSLPVMVEGDRLKVRQVVYNLAQNALKFTQKGHVCIIFRRIQASSGRVGVRIAVEDSGRGIPAEKFDQILKPFAQAQHGDSERGHGLGLAIVGKMLEALGSKLNLRSFTGQGTIFWADLEFRISEGGRQLERVLQGKRVYLFDTYAVSRQFVKESLEGLGATVLEPSRQVFTVAEVDTLFIHSNHPEVTEILASSAGKIDKRMILDCDFEAVLADRSVRVEGFCPIHRLVELFRAPLINHPAYSQPKVESGCALVVDDDPICRTCLLEELRLLGYRVDAAGTKAQALQLARQCLYDVIVVDGYIGGTTGPELYRRLWKEGLVKPETRILVVTGDPDTWRERIRVTDNHIHVIGKPASIEELARILLTERDPGGQSLDPERLKTLSALGQAAVRELFQVYSSALPEMLEGLRSAMFRDDKKAVEMAAHRLRGASSTIGLSGIERVAAGLERSAHNSTTWNDWYQQLLATVAKLKQNGIIEGGNHGIQALVSVTD